MYRLLVTRGPDKGLSFDIRSDRVTIGSGRDVEFALTDRLVKSRHLMVVFEEGSWKAVTYAQDAAVFIDRRWVHPQTGQRGARIFLGASQILLFAGQIDLATATAGEEALDFDAETLRDDAVNQVRDRPMRFRADMTGKAQPVRDDDNNPRGSKKRKTLSGQRSQVFSGKAGMMRLPATIEDGRKAEPPRESRRRTWDAQAGGREKAIARHTPAAKGQLISISETAVSAMPSESRDLAVLYERDGTFASELRILATRMEDLRVNLGYRSFLVTSSGDGQGKTVTAANLALVMSEDSDRKVALVDANFRSPRAAELFNLDKRRSLLSALNGDYPLSQCVARVLGRNLIVLHAGGVHKNPASILSSPKFKGLIGELYQSVDFLIIDAPSAIPHADVPLLTKHVDAVFMVAQAYKTNRAALDRALNTVGRSRVAGGVFVDRPRK